MNRPKEVTTVDKFQGQQNDFILLSLVRTRFVGHLRDVRRLPTFQLLLQRPDRLALNLNEITSYTKRHVEDTGPIHLVSGVEEMISIFNWRYQENFQASWAPELLRQIGTRVSETRFFRH
ncbi:rna helicase aquarius [Quercus suber]|uniref:Rna helicase aquarius n=1 Tax=Quercus suber TaxID=58331 RepID=A0AAW0JST2_QUESU